MPQTVVEVRVIRCIGEFLAEDGPTYPDIKMTMTLDGDLGLDSLDRVELCLKLEDEFLVTIEDSRVKELTTVAELVAYVEGRLGVQ